MNEMNIPTEFLTGNRSKARKLQVVKVCKTRLYKISIKSIYNIQYILNIYIFRVILYK